MGVSGQPRFAPTYAREVGDEWIRDALAAGIPPEQLAIELQPVVRISTGEVWGAESFLRWNHPDRGRVSAVEWIPVAAATGALVELTLGAVPDVARVAGELGGPVLSVNIDGVVLADERVALLADPAAEGRLAVEVHHLQFAVERAREIQPEHHWAEVDDLAARLAGLRERGVAVWLDDLGDDPELRLDLALPRGRRREARQGRARVAPRRTRSPGRRDPRRGSRSDRRRGRDRGARTGWSPPQASIWPKGSSTPGRSLSIGSPSSARVSGVSDGEPALLSATPVLGVDDVEAALRWWRDVAGFRERFREPGDGSCSRPDELRRARPRPRHGAISFVEPKPKPTSARAT